MTYFTALALRNFTVLKKIEKKTYYLEKAVFPATLINTFLRAIHRKKTSQFNDRFADL